jgi:hypothetical protein
MMHPKLMKQRVVLNHLILHLVKQHRSSLYICTLKYKRYHYLKNIPNVIS